MVSLINGDFLLSGAAICIRAYWEAPLVLRKLLLMFRHSLFLQVIIRLPLSVTSATATASRFSSAASILNWSTSFLSSTTAILSWDSDMASSVPSRPSYFFGTLSRSIVMLSASSPMATHTPPAPKSLHLFIIFAASGFLKNLCSFLSVGGLPFCTSAPHVSID